MICKHEPHVDNVDEDPHEASSPAGMVIHKAKALSYVGGPATSLCGGSAPDGFRWGLTDFVSVVTCTACKAVLGNPPVYWEWWMNHEVGDYLRLFLGEDDDPKPEHLALVSRPTHLQRPGEPEVWWGRVIQRSESHSSVDTQPGTLEDVIVEVGVILKRELPPIPKEMT